MSRSTGRVDSSHGAPHDGEYVSIFDIGRSTSAPWKKSESKFGAGDVKECLTTNGHGRDTRDFVVQKFLRKVVLFTNTFIRPTIGPIEFGDDRFVFFNAYLIYPIFVTVECCKRSVGAIAQDLDRVENDLGGQMLVGCIRQPDSRLPPVVVRRRQCMPSGFDSSRSRARLSSW